MNRSFAGWVLGDIFLVWVLLAPANAISDAGKRIAIDPGSVHSVIAEVLRWKDPGLASFSSENRKDQELDQVLERMGVPATQRPLLLDERASRAEVLKALDLAVVRACAAGKHAAFLLRGTRAPQGQGFFCDS